MTTELRKAVDEWAASVADHPSRPEALRRLVEHALRVGTADRKTRYETEVTELVATVGAERYSVSVSRKTLSVWVAAGDFHGSRIKVTARSPESALDHWIRAAKYADKRTQLRISRRPIAKTSQ